MPIGLPNKMHRILFDLLRNVDHFDGYIYGVSQRRLFSNLIGSRTTNQPASIMEKSIAICS